jgi:hypothetical protein
MHEPLGDGVANEALHAKSAIIGWSSAADMHAACYHVIYKEN